MSANPSVGFYIDRIIGLVGYSIFVVLFTYQIYLYYTVIPREPTSKLRIHIACLLSSLLLLVYSVEGQGVFYKEPRLFWLIITNLGVSTVTATFSMVIYSHFQLFYGQALKKTPTWILIALVINWLLFTIIIHVCYIALVLVDKNVYEIMWEVAVIWFFSVLCLIDLSGYWLVKQMILGIRKRVQEKSLGQKLRRIRRFHIFINLSMLAFIADCPYWIFVEVQQGWDAHEEPVKPNQYFPNTQIYSFLLSLGVFYWWAFIESTPHAVKEEEGEVEHNCRFPLCCWCQSIDFGDETTLVLKKSQVGYDAMLEPSTAIKLEPSYDWQQSADPGQLYVDESVEDEEFRKIRSFVYHHENPHGQNLLPTKS